MPEAFHGLGRTRPVVGVAMVVFLLSLVGIPPLGGFADKFMLFAAAMDIDPTWLAVVAIANSVLPLGVYLRIVVPIYRAPGAAVALRGVGTRLGAVMLLLCMATVAIGLAVQLVLARLGIGAVG